MEPLLLAASFSAAALLGLFGMLARNAVGGARLRRHLRRLKTVPLEDLARGR